MEGQNQQLSAYQPEVKCRLDGGSGYVKYCGVCGDIAKSYHFGGLSCDSCKAFFRRSVQNDNYVHFHCCHSGQCLITMGNRKSCQYCRMQRCFAIGMEKSWVMTEEERKALMKARAEKKLNKHLEQRQQQGASLADHRRPSYSKSGDEETSSSTNSGLGTDCYVPRVEQMGEYLQPLEIKDIESIVTKYLHAYQQVPYRMELRQHDDDRPGVQVMEMFGTLIRRFAYYSRLMADFASLPFSDQSILLKGGVLEMCLLRGALVFDPRTNHWPNADITSIYKDAPKLQLGNITNLISSELFGMHMEFIGFIHQMDVDEPTIMLLVMIVLFTPERQGLQCADWIDSFQSYYTVLLEHYMNWRFGRVRARIMFSKLLTKLSDLRQLSETHNDTNLTLGGDEVAAIQHQLHNLQINPYPHCQVVPETKNESAPSMIQASTHQQQMTTGNQIAQQFAQAMQRSVAQLIETPCFGFDWVKPDYPFYSPHDFGGQNVTVNPATVHVEEYQNGVTLASADGQADQYTDYSLAGKDVADLFNELEEFINESEILSVPPVF